MSFNVSWIIQLKDEYSQKARDIAKSTARIRNQINKTIPKTNRFSRALRNIRASGLKAQRSLKRLKTETEGLTSKFIKLGVTLFALSLPIRQAIEFESAMADVRKVVDFKTPRGFEQMGREIQKMAKTIPITQSGLADIVAAGGRLGIPAGDLTKFAITASKTAVAFDITAEMAGDSLANLSNRMGVPIGKIEELADAINFLADNTAAKAPAVLNILSRTAGQFKTLELDPAKAAGIAAFFAQIAPTTELAASGINVMIGRLQNLGPAMTKALVTDPEGTIRKVLLKLSQLDKVSRIEAIKEIFGEDQRIATNILSAVASLDLYDKTLGLVGKRTQFVGSMTREFNIRSETAGNQLILLRNRVRNLGITIGTQFLPFIKGATALLGFLADVITTVARNTGPLLPMLAAFAGVLLTFSVAALAVKGLSIAFLALNVALLVNPIVLILAAVAALIVGIIKLIELLKKLRPFGNQPLLASSEEGKMAARQFEQDIINRAKADINLTNTRETKSTINMNIVDPGGLVKSVQSKTSKNNSFNTNLVTGQNMAGAGVN